MKECDLSIIVTTYNWPQALRAVFHSLKNQLNQNFEVIIADDGSGQSTRDLVEEWMKKMPVPVHHVFQEDQGFRAAAIRNKAILKANSDYIIFIDGDCILPPYFIEQHLALREKDYFVAGNRILLNQKFTIKVLSEDLRVENWGFWKWMLARVQGNCNRVLPFLRLPLGKFRKSRPNRWRGAMGCHLAAWKEDLLKVNGWEEHYQGWGYEDSDLVIRLIQAGIKRKDARFAAPVIHLWHPIRSREDEQSNWERLQHRRNSGAHWAEKGLEQVEGRV